MYVSSRRKYHTFDEAKKFHKTDIRSSHLWQRVTCLQ